MQDITPKKLTFRQDKFAMAYVETSNASEAYRRAYSTENMKPETVNREAFDVLNNPNVAARINELKQEMLTRHRVTVDSLTAEYDEVKALALQLEQPAAAVSAINGKAKIHGFDKVQVDVDNAITVKIIDLSGKGGE